MVITEQKCTFFILIQRIRLDCLTQFSSILKVIGEILMLTNVDPAKTVRDLAAFLNVDEKTIYRLVTKGELPGFKVLSSRRFQRCCLVQWIEFKKSETKLVTKYSKELI